MRILGRLLILIIVLGLIALSDFPWEFDFNFNKKTQVSWADEYQSYPAFWLHPDTKLTYELPSNIRQLRLIFTPITGSTSNAQVIFEDNQMQSRTIELEFKEENNIIDTGLPKRFFNGPSDQQAGLSEIKLINVAAGAQLSKFSLMLTGSDVPIAARIAVLEQQPEQKLPLRWARMHESKKEQLLSEHIYPSELVATSERLAGLAYRWLPVGPSATEGEELDRVTLFVRKGNIEQEDVQVPIDALNVIGPLRWQTFDAAQIGELAELRCSSINDDKLDYLAVTRVVPETLEQKQEFYQGDSSLISVSLGPQPGFYKVAASHPCELGFFDHESNEIDLPRQYFRSTVLSPDQDIQYQLAPNTTSKQPLRLDARIVADITTSIPTQIPIDWMVLDLNNTPLLTGTLHVSNEVNQYQSSADDPLSQQVYQKESQFILAPANAAKLLVKKGQTDTTEGSPQFSVLVNAYARPDNLPLLVSPDVEDRDTKTLDVAKWFLMQPEANKAAAPLQQHLLTWNTPLPEPRETQQNNQWESLTSIENAAIYELLVKELYYPKDDSAARPQLLYSPINGTHNTINLLADNQQRRITPQLLYSRSKTGPTQVTLQWDNQQPTTEWLYAPAGRVNLPSTQAGQHQLSILSSEPVNWYINYLAAQDDTVYRVRQAHQLQKTLTFNVQKTEASEWISFRYFPATAKAHTISIRVATKRSSGQSDDYTIPERKFLIPEQTSVATVSMLNQDQHRLWSPHKLNFLLGSDLDNSQHQITVTTSLPDSGFLQAGYTRANVSWQSEHIVEYDNVE